MSSFNRIILIGRLTREPEIKFIPSGKAVGRFGLAVNRARSKEKTADFFEIIVWEKLADICGKYLNKGSLVLIEGEVQTGSYENKEGGKVKTFEVVCSNMRMLGDKGISDAGEGNTKSYDKPKKAVNVFKDEIIDEFDADEMPF